MKSRFPENNNMILIKLPESWSFDIITEIISNPNAMSSSDINSIKFMKELMLNLTKDRIIQHSFSNMLISAPNDLEYCKTYSFKFCLINNNNVLLSIIKNKTHQVSYNDLNIETVVFVHRDRYIKIIFKENISFHQTLSLPLFIINHSMLVEMMQLQYCIDFRVIGDDIFVDDSIPGCNYANNSHLFGVHSKPNNCLNSQLFNPNVLFSKTMGPRHSSPHTNIRNPSTTTANDQEKILNNIEVMWLEINQLKAENKRLNDRIIDVERHPWLNQIIG